ncbi:MAG: VCBS repeat-containing protein, partial [Saprospiraceae bacterium]|nr:VCBS repeat-containing protein [Saprospiraceae bacterium]
MKKSILLSLFFLAGFQLYAQDFTQINLQSGIGSFTIADFDGDGDEDVFGIDYINFGASSDIYLLRNNGGSPISFESILLQNDAGFRANPDAADYDGDGDMDVVLAKNDGSDIFVLKNDGTGVFVEDSLGVDGDNDLEFQDLEGDGDMDIIGGNTDFNTLSIYVNNGSQSYTKTELLLSTPDYFRNFSTGDVDGDGDIDIAVGYDKAFTGINLETFQNDGNNNFTAKTWALTEFNKINKVEIADYNKDGKMDIGAAGEVKYVVLTNIGNFNFLIEPGVAYAGSSIYGFISLDPVDVNGDDIPDPVLGDNSDGILWFKNTDTSPLQYEQRTVGSVAPSFTIGHADFDLDGDNDLLTTNGELWLYENNVQQISVINEG